MFIVDFDDTLFDTHRFKQARLDALRAMGISEEMYWRTYQQARGDVTGTVTYTDERHAGAFVGTQFDRTKILAALKDISEKRITEFLFPDSISFLQKLRDTGKKILLLSLGASSFQETKVRGAGIDKLVDDMVFIEESKQYVLDHILRDRKQDDIWFINDKIDETEELVQSFPGVRTVLKRSQSIPEEQYHQSPFTHFDSLSEISDYVLQKR